MRSRFEGAVEGVRPSASVVALYAIASLIGGLISIASAAGSRWQMVALVGLVTTIAVVVLVAANSLPWNRLSHRPVVTSIVFLLVAATAGALRGVAFVELARMWGIRLTSDDAPQIANSVVSAIVWLTLAGLVIGGRHRYRDRYRALLLQTHIDMDWDRHPSVEQVKRNIGSALATADASSEADPRRVAEAIRREIDTNIRPLSHRLWFGAEDEEPRSRPVPLVKDAMATWTVPVRVIAILWFTTAVLGGARWLGLEQGLAASLVSTLLIAGMCVLIGRRTPTSPWWRMGALVCGSVVVIVLTDGILRLMGYPSRLYLDAGSLLLLPMTIVALVVASAAISLIESDRRTILEVASRESREISDKRLQSTFLHNSLQAELTGMAMQLDEAARSGSTHETRAALERVHALLARSISQDFATFQENPPERVDRIIDGWRGICEVSIDVDAAVLGDRRLGIAVQAIEEIIANAVRHGDARHIRVEVKASDLGLLIEAVSDAALVEGRSPSSSGLGTRVLAAISPQGLVVEALDRGSRFVLTIP